jgi:hypothetical protein
MKEPSCFVYSSAGTFLPRLGWWCDAGGGTSKMWDWAEGTGPIGHRQRTPGDFWGVDTKRWGRPDFEGVDHPTTGRAWGT